MDEIAGSGYRSIMSGRAYMRIPFETRRLGGGFMIISI